MEAVEPERTTYHESGRTVAAVRLGIPIKHVTIADDHRTRIAPAATVPQTQARRLQRSRK
jgi:hypothetical protein